jgi:hypothetical protein
MGSGQDAQDRLNQAGSFFGAHWVSLMFAPSKSASERFAPQRLAPSRFAPMNLALLGWNFRARPLTLKMKSEKRIFRLL